MSKPAFTPGIWRVAGYVDEDERDGAAPVVAHDGFIVAEVMKWPQQDANARLIAAAPDMYEALLAAKVVIAMMERPEGMGGRVNAALDRRLAQIDAAIAKAEGRAGHD